MLFGSVLEKVFGGAQKAPRKDRRGYFLEQLTSEPYGSPPRAKGRELADLYNKSPWVRSIVSKVGRAVGRQPWFLERRNGDRIYDHPALDFLDAGCPKLRGRGARQATASLVDLQGECFWIIGRDASNRPMGYAPIPANWVIDIPSDSFNGFRVQPRSGAVLELSSSDVLWFRDPDLQDPYGRGSPLTGAASVEIATDEAASDYLRAFFANRARPDLIITGSEKYPIGEKERPAIEQTWLERFRGPRRAGRPMFSSYPIEVKELGLGLRDNQINDIRSQGKDFIREFYGVPPEIFGAIKNSNRATIDSADYLFAKHTVDPRLAFLLDHLEPFLEAEFNLRGLTLCYESPIPEDNEFALKVVQAAPRHFTRNEVRALAKLAPVDGGDDLPDPEPDNEADNQPDSEADATKSAAVLGVRKALTPEDIIEISSAHEDPQVRAEATLIVDEILAQLIAKFGSELLEEISAAVQFEITGRVAEWIANETPELLGNIDETTRKELRASLVEGLAKSENVELLLARVDKIFADAAKFRAPTIAITTATRLAGFATQIAAEQGGFERKKWLTTDDQLVRATHVPLNGQIQPISGKFVSPSGYQATHPGAFGVASEDINCRCAMRPILEGETRAADMTDAQYQAFFDKAHARMATQLRSRFTDIFEAQKAVIRHEITRLGALRP